MELIVLAATIPFVLGYVSGLKEVLRQMKEHQRRKRAVMVQDFPATNIALPAACVVRGPRWWWATRRRR